MNDGTDYMVVGQRNPDGTFIKGNLISATSSSLAKGQKIVREASIAMLPGVMAKMKEWFYDECVPIELRVKIGTIIIARGAGKEQEAPVGNEHDENDPAKMTGPQIMAALQWCMKNAKKEEGINNESKE